MSRPPGRSRHAVSAIRPIAHAQHASSRAVATFALFLWTPRSSSAVRRSTSLLTPFAARLLAAGPGSWPGASSLECAEQLR